MRLVVGALVLALMAAPGSAQPTPAELGGALFFTSTPAGTNLPISTQLYRMGPDAGDEGAVPLGQGFLYYSQNVEFVTEPLPEFTYLGPAMLRLPLRCTGAAANAGIAINVYARTTSVAYASTTMPLGACAAGQTFDADVPLNLTTLRVPEGWPLTVRLGPPLGNAGYPLGWEIVTGDASRPAGLFGPWTGNPVYLPLHANSSAATRFTWATDADAASYAFRGNVTANTRAEVTVRDLKSGNQIFHSRIEAEGPFELGGVLNAGNSTSWTVTFSVFGGDTWASLDLVPVVVTAVEERIEDPTPGPSTVAPAGAPSLGTAAPTDTSAPNPQQQARASPWPLAYALVALGGLAARRRTPLKG